jgi:AraC family transcriptional regulator, ethanolamine operon transcriptional activator
MSLPCDNLDELTSFELSSLESVLRVCDCELVLLDGNSPRSALQSSVHDGALIGRIGLGMRVRGRFVLPSDWALLAYVQAADEVVSWCHGMPLGPGALITVLPRGAAEFSFSEGSSIIFCLVPMSRLPAAGTVSPLLRTPASIQPGVRRYPPADAFYQRLAADSVADALADDVVEQAIALHVQASTAAGFNDGQLSLRTRRSRYLVFRKAEDFMRDNLRRQIYMQELCDAAGVSERLLRYAFEDLTGVSPSRYLSLFRLCEACRALSQADVMSQSVKSVALNCGLWDLSRFADSYRRVFGELPRETLQRGVPAF